MNIQEEIEELLGSSNLIVKLRNRPRNMGEEIKSYFESRIKLLMDEDSSHLTTGAYSLDNLHTRVDNLFILLEDDEFSAVMNVSTDLQIILLGEYTQRLSKFISTMLNSLSKYFLMISGRDYKNITNLLNHHRLLESVVFRYSGNYKIDDPSIFILDKKSYSVELAQMISKFYGYSSVLTPEEVEARPHIAMIENGELLSAARANSSSVYITVIGGVETPIKHRRKGYSTRVMKAFSEYLKRNSVIVNLGTDVENFAALKVYEKVGYDRVGKAALVQFNSDFIEKNIIKNRDY